MSRRPPVVGRFTAQEVALAARNHGMPLEALRHDVTPHGLHYLLVHFDIPEAPSRLALTGLVDNPLEIDIEWLRSLPQKTLRVTLECAGNGRGQLSPRYPSVPWLEEGVSTAEWTGVPLRAVLERARVRPDAIEIVFRGADRGIDRGVAHEFARSLPLAEAMREDVLLAHAMNGVPLPPQHGAPLRLVVPRWYGMASVKWLYAMEALERPFEGVQQTGSYRFRRHAGDKGVPCTLMRVNSLMAPPGIPDFYSRERRLTAGTVTVIGRAWSGVAPIARVDFGVDDEWHAAELCASGHAHAWTAWQARWKAAAGVHELACRATDASGNVQPLEPPWDLSGFGNNGVQRVLVRVTDSTAPSA